MSKDSLLTAVQNINSTDYNFDLYFLKVDFRNQNPYFVFKHSFKKTEYLPDYMVSLKETIIKYQIEPLDGIQEYDGLTGKTVCDKLSTKNDLLKDYWENLVSSVASAPREKIAGKYQGYLLNCRSNRDGLPSIVIAKTGNPIISLDKKNSKVFKHTSGDELEDITDELCRLYLTADFIVVDDVLYAFNQKFEGVFHIEKTLRKLKEQAINQIVETNAFEDLEKTKSLLKKYTSSKTFLTIKKERVEKLNSVNGRKEIAERLGLKFEGDKITIEAQNDANQLIKYLCYKIFVDKETDNLIEVSSVISDNVKKA